MASIGYITTFADFINKYNVEIPRIQRDYTYGSKTEKTEKVLTKLLNDIHDSLKNKKEIILDFVYGCSDAATNTFQPLDGQQRLTTLFLIYFYAACKAPGITITRSFKYATRDNGTIFCQDLIDPSKFTYEKDAGPLVDQIKDSPFYRPSFNDDPSIRSMLVVLERIEDVFADMVTSSAPHELWDAIHQQDAQGAYICPVKFYCLDFGPFSLSDDLYIKMNSRGKQLTEYEIFKSQFEKYIEVNFGKTLKYDTARLFDNDYLDLVWECQGRDKSLIDGAFVNLMKNLFNLLNHKYRNNKAKLDWKKPLTDNMDLLRITIADVIFIRDFLNSFRFIQLNQPGFLKDNFYADETLVLHDASQKGKIRFFKSKVDVLADACSSELKNPKLVSLYAVYQAIKAKQQGLSWQSNLRHVRNLIEFSDDELSHAERVPAMLTEIDAIMRGRISTIAAKDSKFNTTQFAEELEKENHATEWQQLFDYENHDILRGSLTLFAHPDKFDLSNTAIFTTLLNRLDKFSQIFDNNAKNNDREIRANLLSVGNFGQKKAIGNQHMMIGRQYASWRRMLTKSTYYNEVHIMDVLDTASLPLTYRFLSTEDWRYYATASKYYNQTYVPYISPQYGYYHFEDEINKPLEVWLLQSSYNNSSNVMWKLLNHLLKENLPATGITVSRLGNSQGDHVVWINNKITVDALQDGWLIEDLTDNKTIMAWLIAKNNAVSCPYNGNPAQGFLNHVTGHDLIDEILVIINQLINNGQL